MLQRKKYCYICYNMAKEFIRIVLTDDLDHHKHFTKQNNSQ